MIRRCSPLTPRAFFGADIADELLLVMDFHTIFHTIEQHGRVAIGVERNSLFRFDLEAVVLHLREEGNQVVPKFLEGQRLHFVVKGFGAHAHVWIHYQAKLGPQNKSATNNLAGVFFYAVSVGLRVKAEGSEVVEANQVAEVLVSQR